MCLLKRTRCSNSALDHEPFATRWRDIYSSVQRTLEYRLPPERAPGTPRYHEDGRSSFVSTDDGSALARLASQPIELLAKLRQGAERCWSLSPPGSPAVITLVIRLHILYQL